MKILLIYNSYQYGGGEDTNFEALKTIFQKNGHTVITYTKSSKNIEDSLLAKIKTGIEMFANPALHDELEHIIKDKKPDIAHVQNIYPLMNPSIYLFLKKYRIPIVQAIYNYRYLCPKMSLFRDGKVCTLCANKLFKYPSVLYGCYHDSRAASLGFSLSHRYYEIQGSYDDIDVFLFPTEFVRKVYLKYLSIPKSKTAVIPNCYLLPKNQNISIKKSSPFILFSGRLTTEKGLDFLMETMKDVPEIPLVIIGDGPLKDTVKSYSKKYPNIKYQGQLSRTQVMGYVRACSFVVMPSRWYDVLPNVLLEAYAMSKPVVAPKFGVFEDLVKDKSTGILYKYNDSESLKSTIVSLFTDREKIEQFGRGAYAVYLKNYTEVIYYQNMMRLYNNLYVNH